MRGLKAVTRFGINRINNLRDFLKGHPIKVIPLGSMTLDYDDVKVAEEWLEKTTHWMDHKIVFEYETEFAKWNGSKYAFAFMGGRVALSACIYALDLKPEDEVILPGYTCVVVPNAFHYAGIKTVYCDIELETFGLNVDDVRKKITPKTRAILLHHLYGLVCRDYDAILEIADKFGLYVIEDCAQSTGAEYRGKKVGNRGQVSFYSSEQTKVFNTIQGGIATTNEERLVERMREYYNKAPYPDDSWIENQLYNVILNYYRFKHPQRWWLEDIVNIFYGQRRIISITVDEEKGICPSHYGRKMPAPIAALGLNQLKKIEFYNEKRRLIAKYWDSWCERKGYKQPFIKSNSKPIYLRYPVLVEPEKKRDISWARKELGVELGVWFLSHIHPVPRGVEGCSQADVAVKKCVNFPCLM
ncbi:MAG: DegT/DnrJ/EryC1/StrS family aminotransferase [Thermodesulfobacteriota bacterium]